MRISPLGPPEQFALGWVHFRARNYEKAVEQLTWALSQWPEYPWTASFLAASQLFSGRPALAIPTCRKTISSPNIPTSLAVLAATLGRAGEIEDARQILEQLEHIESTAYLDPCPLAVAYAGLGEDEQALSALERLVEEARSSPGRSPSRYSSTRCGATRGFDASSRRYDCRHWSCADDVGP